MRLPAVVFRDQLRPGRIDASLVAQQTLAGVAIIPEAEFQEH